MFVNFSFASCNQSENKRQTEMEISWAEMNLKVDEIISTPQIVKAMRELIGD